MPSTDLPALTRGLAEFSAKAPVPLNALAVALDGITDAAGLIVRARYEPVVRAALAHVLEPQPRGASSLLLGAGQAPARDAAFVNAAAAHAFAMDDVAWGCHPSAILFPTVLAVGEAASASGRELLEAWVIGYEVIAELASREPGSWHSTGWHPSGFIGPVAAAAAASRLMKLDADQTQAALGIAASFTGGLAANFGTDTKALHAAHAARSGVEAAQLASRGVTASPAALEHANGLLRLISPAKDKVNTANPFDPARPPWRVLQAGISIKKYPLCYSLHRIADAGIDIASRPGFDAGAVRGIDVWIGSRQAAMAPHLQPSIGLQARYSVPFAVASGLAARAAGFAQLDPEFFGSVRVRELVSLTQVHTLDGTSSDDPVFAPFDRVAVRMENGDLLDSGEISFARGHATLPLTREQLEAKFMDCCSQMDKSRAARLFGALQRLESLGDLRELVQAVT